MQCGLLFACALATACAAASSPSHAHSQGHCEENSEGAEGSWDSADTSCLLARRQVIDLEVDEAEADAYDIFMESYGEIAAFNEGMRYIKLSIMTLVGLIEYLGPFFSLLINIFWGTAGDHDKALIEAIQRWTTEYVGSAITLEIHQQMQAKFDTIKRGFKSYEQCKSYVKEKATDQLEAQISKCDNILITLCFASEEALNVVNRSSYRGRLMSDFVMASTIKLSLWRERYDSAAYYRKQTGNESTLFPNTTEAKMNMKHDYKRIEEDLASMVPEWKKWRYDKIVIKDDSEKRHEGQCSQFRLVDRLKPEYNRKFYNIQCKIRAWYVDAPKLKDTLRDMHFRRVQFSEMIPMLKMFTGLALFIPGQEHFELQRGKVLPQYLELGPFSAWINGETQMTEGNMHRMAYPDQEVPVVHGQRWDILEVKKAGMLDQLIFLRDWEMWDREVLKYPEIDWGSEKSQRMRLPYDQCGLHLGFVDGMIQSWTTFEIKNLTKTWNGTSKAEGYFNTGAYVCGLYKFRQITKIRSDANRTGDAFMLNFQFFPGEAH